MLGSPRSDTYTRRCHLCTVDCCVYRSHVDLYALKDNAYRRQCDLDQVHCGARWPRREPDQKRCWVYRDHCSLYTVQCGVYQEHCALFSDDC